MPQRRCAGPTTEDAPVVLGVDVGGTKILVGYVDREAQVHHSARYRMDRTNQQATLNSIYRAIDDFRALDWNGLAPCAIGMGLVGHTDPASGIWRHAMNLSVKEPVPIAEELSHRYGTPVWIDNDVRAATLAELQYGAGREVSDFVYLNVGTGLACGVVVNGLILRGANNYAGELGHMAVEPDGERCAQCGRRGCLEPIASGGGMVDQVKKRYGRYPKSLLGEALRSGHLTALDIVEATRLGDELAEQVTSRALRALGIAVVNLVNLLNPELIVLGGGVFAEGWGIAELRTYVTERALPAASESLRGIVRSRLQADQVGLLGAACVAWEHIPQG